MKLNSLTSTAICASIWLLGTTTQCTSSHFSPSLSIYLKQRPAFILRGGSSSNKESTQYGRLSDDFFRLTPEQIETFHREGCVTIENVLTDVEVDELQKIFDLFVAGEIPVPGKDFCDMSQPCTYQSIR